MGRTLHMRAGSIWIWWVNILSTIIYFPKLKERGTLLHYVLSVVDAFFRPLGISSPVCDSYPDSKVHGANMGPIWVLSAPDGPHDALMNLAIWVVSAVVFANAMDWLDVCWLSGFCLYLYLPRCSIMTHLGVRESSLAHTNNRLLHVRYQATI